LCELKWRADCVSDKPVLHSGELVIDAWGMHRVGEFRRLFLYKDLINGFFAVEISISVLVEYRLTCFFACLRFCQYPFVGYVILIDIAHILDRF